MLNAGNIIDLMAHKLGKTPDSRHSLWDTLNRAGRELVTAHDWYWRASGETLLPVVGGQSYLNLPSDFGELVTVYVPNVGEFTAVETVSMERVAYLRASESLGVTTGLLRIFFPGYTTANAGPLGTPRRRAELYPTPNTSGEPTLRVFYKRSWIEIDTDDRQAVPNIPETFEQALISKARALAWSIENDIPSHDDTIYAAELVRLKDAEARTQPSMGQVYGGVNARISQAYLNNRYPRRATL